MKKNNSIIVATVILVLLIIGFVIGLKQLLSPATLTTNEQPQNTPLSNLSTEKTTLPTTVLPSLPPLAETIKTLDNDSIIVTGEKGDMHLPKNSSIVKVLRRTGTGSLMPATFSDLKVGQKTTLKIIVPGKQAELIIEQ